MHYIPGLRLRADQESEIVGLDESEMGEYAYDYVSLQQELGFSVNVSTTTRMPVVFE